LAFIGKPPFNSIDRTILENTDSRRQTQVKKSVKSVREASVSKRCSPSQVQFRAQALKGGDGLLAQAGRLNFIALVGV